MESVRVIVGITGASGPIYGIRLLQVLQNLPKVESHLVYTQAAERTIALESDLCLEQVRKLANVCHQPDDIAAAISSGSFQTTGMVIAPCSISTLSCIAASITKDLLTRAADVTLKERRPLVLLVRESPLHLGHLHRMMEATQIGAIVAPPIPSFYHRPGSVTDIVDHSVGRALELLGLELDWLKRWSTPESPDKAK